MSDGQTIGYECLKLVEEMTRRCYCLAFFGGPGQTFEARFFKHGESPWGWEDWDQMGAAPDAEATFIALDPEDAIRGAAGLREAEFRRPEVGA